MERAVTRRESPARRAATFVVRRHAIVLLAAVAVTAAAVRAASGLRIQTDLAALLPDDYVSVRTMRAISREVGGFETLQLLVQGEHFPAMEAYATELADALVREPLVRQVDYRRDVEFYRRHALLYLPLEDLEDLRDTLAQRIAQARRRPLSTFLGRTTDGERGRAALDELLDRAGGRSPYYVNDDRTVLVLNVFPTGSNSDIGFARRFLGAVQAVVRAHPPERHHPSLFVEYGGNFKNKIDEYEVLIGDVQSTAVVGLTAVLLLIAFYFRRLTAVLVVGVPLSMSLAWTFGLTQIAIGELNTLTVFLFLILFGLGVDFGIHFLARYGEWRRALPSPHDAARETILTTGRALSATAVTTAAAFASLTFADFKGFSQFGFIAAIGVFAALLATVTVQPALICLLERWHVFRPTPAGGTPRSLPPLSRRLAWSVVMVGGAGALIGAVGLSHLELQYDFTNLRANLPASEAVKRKLGPIFTESNSPALVLVRGSDDAAELERAVRERVDSTPTIARVRTLHGALPDRQTEKLAVIAEIDRLARQMARAGLSRDQRRLDALRELTAVGAVQVGDLPEEIKRLFRSRDGTLGTFAYIYPAVALRDGRNAIAFADDVGELRAPSGRVYHAANASIIFADMLRVMRREGTWAAVVTFGVIAVVLLVDLRHIRGTLLVLTPLAIGMLWLVAIMWAFGIKLNFFNMVAIPTVIGVGVDSGIHLYHRYRRETPGSTGIVLRHTGGAVLLATVTTMVGFSGLVLARHPGLNSVGTLALLGLATTLLAALTVLPAMLHLWETPAPHGAGATKP